jgi:hypothetical protein
MAKGKAFDHPSTRAGIILDWPSKDYGLGRGHGMAIVRIIKHGISDDHVNSGGTHADLRHRLILRARFGNGSA